MSGQAGRPTAQRPPAELPAAAAALDPRRTEGGGPAEAWRAFRTATYLGYQLEANWTDPVLFFIYSVAKPVSAALILVFMVDIIAGGSASGASGFRAFVIVGSALWSFVTSGVTGLGWSILDDRERYRMLRYVYVSPSAFWLVMLGRGTARVAVGAMGAAITLALGIVVLGVGFDPWRVDVPLLVTSMVLGLGAIVAIAVVLAAVCLQSRQDAWRYPEAVAGALFLVAGAVFPLGVLPDALQAIGLATPLAWWVEGVRTALFPGVPTGIGGPGSLFERLAGHPVPTSFEVVAALLATGAVVTLGAALLFRFSERRAKDRGLIDQTTGS